MVTRKVRHKNSDGTVIEADIGAMAENVVEDPEHRFVTDKDMAAWNAASESIKKLTTIHTVPSQNGSLTYTGGVQTPVWDHYDSEKMTIGGDVSGTDAGTYTATFTPKEGIQWEDGTDTARTVSWTIGKANVATPVQSGSLTYTGSEQSPKWSNYDSAKMTMGGTTTGTDAGSYTATFTPGSNYQWEDGTDTARTVSWTIGKANVATPVQSGSLTYTGSEQSPKWSNYDSAKMTVGGTTTGTDAGSYTATFTPGSNYQWSDGTTAAKSITWKINKALGSLTLDKSSLTLAGGITTGTVIATRSGNGAISATSSNPDIVAVSVSGTIITITLTGNTNDTATITVRCAEGTNHTAPANQTISVTVVVVSPILADNTPEDIKSTAQSGQAANLWSIGDKVPIEVSGTVGSVNFNGTYYAFIIGFNHNSSVEGGNSIHFQFGKNAGGTDIAFVDAGYNTYYSSNESARFVMNDSNANSGGWANSYMRQTICAAFINALPVAWQNAIAICCKYSDNTGNGSNIASYVTKTFDKIWMLAEFEVFGIRTGANSAEQNYQKQYDYYKNGNSRVKYKHSDTGTACHWWLRSVSTTNTNSFRSVGTDGSNNYSIASYSLGFAPGFKVA